MRRAPVRLLSAVRYVHAVGFRERDLVDLRGHGQFCRTLCAHCRVQCGDLCWPERPSHRCEVALDRAMETRGLPHLGPALPSLVDRQDAHSQCTCRLVRWQSHLQCLFAAAWRACWPQRRDRVESHTCLHRPHFDRRQHGHPKGCGLNGLQGPIQSHLYRAGAYW